MHNLADGEGRFTCLNGRATGYASVWKKEYQKNGEREIDYYVQVVQKDGYKVLRNLANRHTLRIQNNGQAEEAVPGTAEWRPVSGSWIDPK